MSELGRLAEYTGAAVEKIAGEGRAPTPGQIAGELRRMTRQLRDHYLKANTDAQHPPQDEWLCDNYYVLEKESKQSQRELRTLAKNGGGRELGFLFQVLDRVIGGCMPPVEDEAVAAMLVEIGRREALNERQFSFVPCAVKIILIRQAWRACLELRRDREIAYAIVGLSKLSSVDFDSIIRRCSEVEEVLLRDPAGVYEKMSSESRRHYRYLVACIAREEGRNEGEVARRLLEQAEEAGEGPGRHIGRGILGHPILLEPRRRRGKLALCAGVVLPLLLSALAAALCRQWWLTVLLYLPLWEVLRTPLTQIALSGVGADHLPRMDLRKVERKPKTAVLVSTLLPKASDAPALARRLEQLYFSNSDPDLYFCILADFKEWDFPSDEKDESQVAACKKVIEELNAQYDNRFQLFLRRRTYNRSQKRYSGWERKRGAITEFVRFLKGEETSVHTFVGDRGVLREIKYLIALDADTRLLYESAQTLVAAAIHPLNRPVVSPEGIVTEGYGILAPKIAIDLRSAKATPFSRVLSGCGGVTAYDTQDKDFYQDLFSESIFAGKGLIDVDAFHALLDRRFPENQVLSHDILEGAYLRVGFVSDVEMTDQAPASMSSWLARSHRWTRGDWQNLPFLAARYRAEGKVWENPISTLSKYKLFDNLRRSLVPVCALLCLGAALFAWGPARWVLALAGLLAVTFSSLWAAGFSLLSGGLFTLSRKFFTRTLSHTLELVAQGFFFLVMTPAQALLTLDAAGRSLWRTYVSRKRMLEWTTAAQSDLQTISLWACVRRYWLAELLGAAFLLLSLDSLLCLAGVAFVLLLPVAYYTASPTREDRRALSPGDRDALLSYNAAMWRYYEDFADARNHYLPPDNIQQSPVYRVATRTSPTNIGMMLLSILAARDFDFIDTEGLYRRIDRTLSTVEKLEKWHGNLYNWYDTETLELLRPAFVSTVDSGNFIGCLVALKEGLREFADKRPAFTELVARVEALIEATDLRPFYNRKKRLFSIGWDADRQELSGSHYDFLMSEARLTSYYAVARKIVSKKHWGAMGRTMSRSGSYAGPVSWTGTMFEYYMPHLLLPVYEGSLISEALTYCLYCQKKWAKAKDVPWGISESAYYAFDNNLNYQYKAHGVQKVGVKRYLDRELVISPYSTFITIPQNPNSSMENLRRLRKLGVYGRYGFYEAVDFTPGRVGAGGLGVTRSYMAHHIGMSMLASCNALLDNRMQRRFMQDNFMGSAKEFLEEKIAKNTVVYDEMKSSGFREEKQERPRRVEETGEIIPQAPRCLLLTNGEMTDILTDAGPGYLKFGDLDLTRRSLDLLRSPQGFVGLVRAGGQLLPLTRAPFYEPGVEHRVETQEQSVTFYARKKDLETGMRCLIHPTISCQQRQLVIKNHAAKKEQVQVLLYFEPVLAAWADYSAHPAFSKLFVTARYHPDTKTLVFTRRSRSGTDAMHLAAGFLEELDFSFETRREALMSAPGGLEDLARFHRKEFSNNGGGVPDACCAIRFEREVSGGGQVRATLLLSASRSEEEAVASVISMRKIGLLEPKHAAKSPLLGESLEGRLGCNILGSLLFHQAGGGRRREKIENELDQSGLWSTGISGDLPIVLIDGAEALAGDALGSYFRLHAILRSRNVAFDLCVIHEKEETRRELEQLLERESAPGILGTRGGVFLLLRRNLDAPVLTLLRAASRHIAGSGLGEERGEPFRPMRIRQVSPAPMPVRAELTVQGGACAGGAFYVDKSSPLPYCHVLASPVFGTLVSDRALGYTWAYNSRENKLTPWYNDICADNRGEQLLLRCGGESWDLIAGSRASFGTGERPGACYEGTLEAAKLRLHSRVEVGVAERGCAKYVEVTLENKGDREAAASLAYYLEPVLGVTRDTARYVKLREDGDTLVLENRYNPALRSCAALRAEGAGEELYFMSNRAAFLSGDWENRGVLPQDDPCAAVIIPIKLPPKRDSRIRFILSAGRTPEGAARMARLPRQTAGAEREGGVALHSPDEALNQFINHFAPHQILSSRIRGRTAFYQCGGAYGFRDQLQDVAAYLPLSPRPARRQILRCCAVQFGEGDVLHWWHDLPGGVKGVRTRFSDDLLWLPLTAAEYVEKTGDASLLDVQVAYLEAEELAPGEQERYIAPRRSERRETVFRHCIRALERGYNVDERGLPRIGCGDWNDGFSSVGTKGRGVSVWLALFLSMTLERFAPICRRRGEAVLERTCLERAAALKGAVENHCWDGDWYLRAFFDDGRPMGSRSSPECRIDLLPQSFGVPAGLGDRDRVKRGMDSAWERLVDGELRLVRLFDPPFHASDQNPGYVKAYPPGIRENGGQYTHAAVWFAIALLEAGETERGWQVLRMLNPFDRAGRADLAERYKLEPYCIPADIYTNGSAAGRGGWSLYTGAASWYYRAAVEHLLGLRLQGETVRFAPHIPSEWPELRAEAELRGTRLHILIRRGNGGKGIRLLCDGEEVGSIPLTGGERRVEVVLPEK